VGGVSIDGELVLELRLSPRLERRYTSSPRLERRYTSSPRLERRYTSSRCPAHPAAASLLRSPQLSDDAESLRKISNELRFAEANLNLQRRRKQSQVTSAPWLCVVNRQGLQHARGTAMLMMLLRSLWEPAVTQQRAAWVITDMHASAWPAKRGTTSSCSSGWQAPGGHVVGGEGRPLGAAEAREIGGRRIAGC
jgi:hypothetical protein